MWHLRKIHHTVDNAKTADIDVAFSMRQMMQLL